MQIAPIGVVQGAPSPEIQALFTRLVCELGAQIRIAGVIEHDPDPDQCGGRGVLRSIADGAAFPLFQDLGPCSTACSLDGRGVLLAGAAVERDIAAGCDLVILNKFGKLEAGREGLLSAYQTAFDRGVPVLTSIASHRREAWENFASGHFSYLPPDADALQAWCAGVVQREAASLDERRFDRQHDAI